MYKILFLNLPPNEYVIRNSVNQKFSNRFLTNVNSAGFYSFIHDGVMYNDIVMIPSDDNIKRFLRIYDSGSVDWYVGDKGIQLIRI